MLLEDRAKALRDVLPLPSEATAAPAGSLAQPPQAAQPVESAAEAMLAIQQRLQAGCGVSRWAEAPGGLRFLPQWLARGGCPLESG
eukprot:11365441-Alexandrium_andersonii.AAC.1